MTSSIKKKTYFSNARFDFNGCTKRLPGQIQMNQTRMKENNEIDLFVQK